LYKLFGGRRANSPPDRAAEDDEEVGLDRIGSGRFAQAVSEAAAVGRAAAWISNLRAEPVSGAR
jgi:hypothetical protein